MKDIPDSCHSGRRGLQWPLHERALVSFSSSSSWCPVESEFGALGLPPALPLRLSPAARPPARRPPALSPQRSPQRVPLQCSPQLRRPTLRVLASLGYGQELAWGLNLRNAGWRGTMANKARRGTKRGGRETESSIQILRTVYGFRVNIIISKIYNKIKVKFFR